MAIISQETFDKFTEEEKKKVVEYFLGTKDTNISATIIMQKLFGKENLQPEPKIKIWKDIENYLEIIPDFKEIVHNLDVGCCNQKVTNKIIATYKISKLIELGFGGVVTDEEWKDETIRKESIVPCDVRDDFKSITCYYHSDKNLIAFHNINQAKEFMSYKENVELVKQYNMI